MIVAKPGFLLLFAGVWAPPGLLALVDWVSVLLVGPRANSLNLTMLAAMRMPADWSSVSAANKRVSTSGVAVFKSTFPVSSSMSTIARSPPGIWHRNGNLTVCWVAPAKDSAIARLTALSAAVLVAVMEASLDATLVRYRAPTITATASRLISPKLQITATNAKP